MSSKLDRKEFIKLSSGAAAGVFVGVLSRPAAGRSIVRNVVKNNAENAPQLITLDANPPLDTNAVRYFIDDIQVSELTNLYGQQTNTKPVWKTVVDPAWFEGSEHTLRIEAETPNDTITLEERTISIAQEAKSGSTISLNGGWLFCDGKDLNNGAAEGSLPKVAQVDFDDSTWATVLVPNSIGYVDQKWNDPDGILGVYRRNITLREAAENEQISIVLKSCYWSGRVFINGAEVGQTKGGYLPTRFDISKELHTGKNEIAIITDNRRSMMGVFDRLHYFYWNWGGLLQGVHIERNPDIALTNLRAEGSRSGALHLWPIGVNKKSTQQKIDMIVEVYDPSGKKVFGPESRSISIPANVDNKALEPVRINIDNPQLWNLDTPNLYTVMAKGDWGSLKERTGFRDVKTSGADLMINGKIIENLQGFDRHEDYPGLGRTQPAGLAHRELKELYVKGFRIFRPAHYPTTPALLDAADELGMLVIEEINVTGLKGAQLATKEVKDFGAQQLTKMIHRDRSHPSIIAWSVGNENLTDEKGAGEYIRDTIKLGRSLDSSRLFTHVTMRASRDKTFEYQDIVAQNYYAGWYTKNIDAVAKVIDDVQKFAGNKPILLSEYGGEAIVGRLGTGKGTEFYQSFIIDSHNKLLNNRSHFIGKLYWTSTEFWCRPDWTGGNPTPVPPFHVKAIQGYYRSENKLGWRVMFSPVRLSFDLKNSNVKETQFGGEIKISSDKSVKVDQKIILTELKGQKTEGTLVILPPIGFKPEDSKQAFKLNPNETKAISISFKGKLPDSLQTADCYIKAVIDGDTEAQPLVFTLSV